MKLIESQYLAIIRQLSIRMPGQNLRTDEALSAYASDFEIEKVNIEDLKNACKTWKNYRDKFPSYHELFKEVYKQKLKRENVNGMLKSCPHDICNGSGWVIISSPQCTATACTCPSGSKLKGVPLFTSSLKSGLKIDESDPYHRIPDTGEIRKGVIEANKTMEKV